MLMAKTVSSLLSPLTQRTNCAPCGRFPLAMLTAALLSTIALSTEAAAEFIPPNEVQIKTETPDPEHPQSEFGTYTYDIDWQGIPVATAKVIVKEEQCPDHSCLTVRAVARSTRGIDIFYRLRHLSESTFAVDSLRPVSFKQKQTENSYSREAEISWRPDGTVKSHFAKKKKPYDIEFSPKNPMFDPISAAFYAKSVPLEIGSTLDVDVFNGRNRFVITFDVVGKEKIEVGKRSVEAYKIEPKVRKLTDTEGEKKFRSAILWISADNKREVLKMESEVFIGSVSAEMTKFEPAAEKAPSADPGLLAQIQNQMESAGRAMLGNVTPGRQ